MLRNIDPSKLEGDHHRRVLVYGAFRGQVKPQQLEARLLVVRSVSSQQTLRLGHRSSVTFVNQPLWHYEVASGRGTKARGSAGDSVISDSRHAAGSG